jgi:hypothetical protein
MERKLPKDQDRFTVVKKIYSLLIDLKMKETSITYGKCFEYVFDITYNNSFLHFITERTVVNNIPHILGAIGFVCIEKGLPPLSCLVVRKTNGKTGELVVTSKPKQGPDFAQQVDQPNVYECHDYPKPGSQEAANFLNSVMAHLLPNGKSCRRR